MPIDVQTIVFSILGGVAIFLYGLTIMSDYLKKIAGSRLKLILEKTTNSPLKGILTGILLTAMIQSSSATAAIVIGLVSANLLSLKNAVGVILGAKIGTTVTSILISFNLGSYALLIVFIGAILLLFFKHKTTKNVGGAILGFGLLFLGLNLMSSSLGQVAQTDAFQAFLTSAGKHPILGMLIGIFATALVQSSSASIGILQELYTTGTIPLVVAVAIVLGSNIGTTITSVLASLKANTAGKKVALSHILITSLSSLVFFIFIYPYTSLLIWISDLLSINHTNSMLTISLSHIILNVIAVFIIFWLINQIVWLVNKLVKDRDDVISQKVILNKQLILSSPVLALENAKQAINEMGIITAQMFELVEKYSFEKDNSALEVAMQCEEMINQLDLDIHNYLVQIGSQNLTTNQMQLVAKYIDTITDFERIGDHLENLSELFEVRHEQKLENSSTVIDEFTNFFSLIKNQLNNVLLSFSKNEVGIAKTIIENENNINLIYKEYRNNNTLRISKDIDDDHSKYYVDIMSNLERIGDHCYNIAENVAYKEFTHIKKEVRA